MAHSRAEWWWKTLPNVGVLILVLLLFWRAETKLDDQREYFEGKIAQIEKDQTELASFAAKHVSDLSDAVGAPELTLESCQPSALEPLHERLRKRIQRLCLAKFGDQVHYPDYEPPG